MFQKAFQISRILAIPTTILSATKYKKSERRTIVQHSLRFRFSCLILRRDKFNRESTAYLTKTTNLEAF